WPQSDDALSRTNVSDRRCDLVRGRSVLQLVEQGRGHSRKAVVLRDGRERAGDEIEGELSEPGRGSPADGSGGGVCHPGGSGGEPVLRGDGGVAGEVWLVFQEQQGAYLAGGGQEAQRPGVVRPARGGVYRVPGAVPGRLSDLEGGEGY